MAHTRASLHAGNLPVELTSFVGRRQGLAELKRALASTRLLTLTGAGGVGKTKLALRAGRESARQYPDGVWFVELASVQDAELVVQAVFTALGLQDHSSSWAVSTLSDYLAAKRPLLILDNCEHVHDAAAVLAGTLLRACPDAADPGDEPAGPRGHRRGRDRRAHACRCPTMALRRRRPSCDRTPWPCSWSAPAPCSRTSPSTPRTPPRS